MSAWLEEKLKKYKESRHKRSIQMAVLLTAVIMVSLTVSALLMKPAISMGDATLEVTADQTNAIFGEPLSVHIKAQSLEEQEETICMLSAETIDAELSGEYIFDENNVAHITDHNGQNVELHRVSESDGTVRYWFGLKKEEKTDFNLNFVSVDARERDAGVLLRSASASTLENVLDRIDADTQQADVLRLIWSNAADRGEAISDKGEDWKYKVSISWDDFLNPYEKSDVTLSTSDVKLKYNVSVSTNTAEYDAGQMEIRLPLSIWTDRDGKAVVPDDFSLPKAPNTSSTYSFHYKIDDHGTPNDKTDDEIVVTNWTKLPPALNQTFSLTYTVTPQKTIDLSKTEIQAKVTAVDNLSQQAEVQKSNTITYQIDTGVKISRFSSYDPQLIYSWPSGFGTAPADFDTSKYNYVKYHYREEYHCNQPYDVTMEFTPSHNGKVVGCNGYGFKQDGENKYRRENDSSSTSTPYFIVAYPRDETDPTPKYSLTCDLKVDAADRHPGHDTDADENDHDSGNSIKSIQWKDYEFVYTGGIDSLKKEKNAFQSVGQAAITKLSMGIDVSDFRFDINSGVYGYNIGEYQYDTFDDALYFECNGKYYPLTEEDYYISGVTMRSYQYTDIDRTNGDTITKTPEPYSLYGYNSKTHEWDLIDTTTSRKYYNFSKDYTKIKISSSDKLTGKAEVFFDVSVTLKSTSPAFAKIMEENPDTSRINIYNFAGMKRYDSETGEWSNSYDKPYLTVATPPGLNQQDYDKDGAYIFRAYATNYMTKLVYRFDSLKRAEKIVNDPVNSAVTVTFNLYANENMNAIEELRDSFEQTEGTFYDLLPLGYRFKGAGTVKAYGVNYSRMPASVKIETVDDWRGTGRQMVIFHVTKKDDTYTNIYRCMYTPIGSLSYYDNAYYTGFQLTFNAEISWDDLQYYPSGTNLMAYQGNKYAGDKDLGADSPYNAVQGEYDGEMRSVFYDVDEDGNTDEYTLYDFATVKPQVAMTVETGITKKVRAAGKIQYTNSAVANINSEYSYRIGLGCSSSGSMKDIIVYDILEEAENTEGHTGERAWKGSFLGIDVSDLTSAGIKPVVYYSTAEGLKYEDADLNIADSSKWSATAPDDLSKVTAIAVDMRKNTSGGDFILEADKAVNFIYKMKAPAELGEEKYTYNRPAYHSFFIPSGAQVGAESTNIGYRTRVELSAYTDVLIQKSDTNRTVTLPGVGFELYTANVSENGEWTKADSENPLLSFVTGVDGKYKIEKLTPGSYLLYEVKTAVGYELPKEPWRITVKKDASVMITDSGGNGVDASVKFGETIYHIINSKIYVLPSTGGIGTEIIYISAAFLILASAGGLLYQKKRREKGGCSC